jgi:hypothetical protein
MNVCLRISFALLLAACSGASGSSSSDDAGPADAGGRDSSAPQPDAGAPLPDGSADDGGIGIACSGAAPTLSADVFPILHKNCTGFEGCHGGFGPTPDAVYKMLVNVAPSRDRCWRGVLVSPGRPDDSYLLHKLVGAGMCPDSRRMPSENGLSNSNIQTIADWICQGAQND